MGRPLMSSGPEPHRTPDPDRAELSPLQQRLPALLTTGGAIGILGAAALFVTVDSGFLVIGIIAGLAFAFGLVGLAGHGALLPLTVGLGIAAPLVLSFGGDEVAMDQFGRVERCLVKSAEDRGNTKRPRVHYLLGCPSGDIVLTVPASERLIGNDGGVKIGPPLRPRFDQPTGWNLVAVLSVPVVMIGAVRIAVKMRQKKKP
jgi:hypothetical protein